jgi:flagellar basal body rod protein FlgC
MTKYTRIKNGECSFQITEVFDSAEKAANPSNDGSNAEVKIENIKLDFTTVKKEHDGKHQNASAEAKGSSREETQEVSGSEVQSK